MSNQENISDTTCFPNLLNTNFEIILENIKIFLIQNWLLWGGLGVGFVTLNDILQL